MNFKMINVNVEFLILIINTNAINLNSIIYTKQGVIGRAPSVIGGGRVLTFRFKQNSPFVLVSCCFQFCISVSIAGCCILMWMSCADCNGGYFSFLE